MFPEVNTKKMTFLVVLKIDFIINFVCNFSKFNNIYLNEIYSVINFIKLYLIKVANITNNKYYIINFKNDEI